MRSREDNAIFTSVPIEDIEFYKQTNEELQQENKQLKDNWNELKKYAKENLYFYSGYQGEDREEDLSIKYLLEKMQELEGKSE